MPSTLAQAKKEARRLNKITPKMKTIIISHPENKGSAFRYNFKFEKRRK